LIRFFAPKIHGGEIMEKPTFFGSFLWRLSQKRTPPGGHGKSESDWLSAFCFCFPHFRLLSSIFS